MKNNVKIKSYQIDKTRWYKLLEITTFLMIFALCVILMYLDFIEHDLSIGVLLFFSFLAITLLSNILIYKITLYQEYLIVQYGLFTHKRINYYDIEHIYVIDRSKESISKENPVFSNNVLAVEYKAKKKLYFSIKEKDEFILSTMLLKHA